MAKVIRWAGYEWKTEKSPGVSFHEDNPHMWYNDDCTRVLSDGTLSLDAKYMPKKYTDSKGRECYPEIAIGLIRTRKVFWHGKFEIYAKLPQGTWLWPAFWVSGDKTWPPEIDIFEGYSDKKGSYRSFQWNKPCAKYAVKTNAWKNVYPDHKQFGASQHKAFKRPNDFNYFTMEWTKDKVNIFYNSHLVRTFDDHKLIQQMNEQGVHVLLNNGCANDAKGLDKDYKPSSFLVKSFVYTPY
jgi:beta-glucanase (GH16 family)